MALACDFTSIYLAILYALFVSDNLNDADVLDMLVLLWMPSVGVLIFWYAGVYRSIVRYIDFSVIFLLLQATSLSLLINFITLNIYGYFSGHRSLCKVKDIYEKLLLELKKIIY